jgi:hypothetical protein
LSFARGLLNGYFSGDGCVDKGGAISGYSCSRLLLEGIQQLLLRFDIVTDMTTRVRHQPRFKSEQPQYIIKIGQGNAIRFAKSIPLIIDYKQARLDKMLANYGKPIERGRHVWRTPYGRQDIIPDIELSTGAISLRRDKVKALMDQLPDNSEDLYVLQSVLDEDVVYDEIISITEVPNTHTHAYDLTVESTRNFNSATGVALADSFHASGVSSASQSVRGVPRFKELLHCTSSKNMKSPIMLLKLPLSKRADQQAGLELMKEVRATHFADLVKRTQIFFDPDDDSTVVDQDAAFTKRSKKVHGGGGPAVSPWLLRMELDPTKLYDHNVDMHELDDVLAEFYEGVVHTSVSDASRAGGPIMRVRLRVDAKSDDALTDLRALEANIMDTVLVKGIKGVRKVSLADQGKMRYDPETDAFKKEADWVVETDGSNLRDALNHPLVDGASVVSNDILEIYAVLGVEAARLALYNEIMAAMDVDNEKVNYRHVSLIVDTMTNKGTLVSIDRHGINAGDIGPLAKCSFEETTDRLIKAGMFGERDRINGVSANIMLGQIAPCGTGDPQVIMDESMLPPIEEETDDVADVASAEGTSALHAIGFVLDDKVRIMGDLTKREPLTLLAAPAS